MRPAAPPVRPAARLDPHRDTDRLPPPLPDGRTTRRAARAPPPASPARATPAARPAVPVPPRRPAACRRSAAAHPTFTHLWCGQCRMRGSRLSLWHQLRALDPIPDLPTELCQPIANLIRPREILRRPRLLPLLQKPLCLVVDLSTLIWLSKGAEADELEHLRQSPSSFAPANLSPI